ncbi:MAG TPA: DUF4912 domain-containing protein [Vicinamibacteria bacterium]|nr:DUF4912 domain-containing protein [Vicinamibacteria bacterium]
MSDSVLSKRNPKRRESARKSRPAERVSGTPFPAGGGAQGSQRKGGRGSPKSQPSSPAGTKAALVEAVAGTLGVANPSLLAPSTVQTASRERLLDGARALGLRGASRLRKQELAARLWETLATHMKGLEEATRSTVAARKFVVGAEREARPLEHIPWSYGVDRVRATAVDPERLFVYWEVTDEAIGRARRELGPDRDRAWLSLRIYDTTGRLFDGTNAHSYFDHRVNREDRQWFFTVGKPGSEGFVEIGMKSHEGYFVKIARSGRVVFPRLQPLRGREPEWLTVLARSGELTREESPRERWPSITSESYAAGQQEASPSPRPDSGAPDDTWGDWSMADPPFLAEPGVPGVTTFIAGETGAWEAPLFTGSWEAGPFTYFVDVPQPTEERYEGSIHTYALGGRTHVVFGPWHVVIRGIHAYRGRAVVARWELYRSWAVERGCEWTSVPASSMLGSSELAAGASERSWRGASELRLAGSSELFFLGASERRWGGASERLFMGASEWRLRGASERRLRGASELSSRGASEKRFLGASERRRGGASEVRARRQ